MTMSKHDGPHGTNLTTAEETGGETERTRSTRQTGYARPAARRDVAVVMAVKRLSAAKTRLNPAYSAIDRRSLVLAMLTDTLTAVMNVSDVCEVTVVTPDPEAGAVARELGARVLSDPTPSGYPDALNYAVRAAEAAVRHRVANVAVVPADLPALRPFEFANAVAAARGHRRSFIGDRHGTGTTALFGFAATLNPAFGPDSSRRHARTAAVGLEGHWPGLRCDVDTPDDIEYALRLGAGRATRRAIGLIQDSYPLPLARPATATT